MRHIYIYVMAAAAMLAACSDDGQVAVAVPPVASGVYTDARDGYVYGWVQYGDLQWTVENSHFFIDNALWCLSYQPAATAGYVNQSAEHVAKHGYLYSLEGARRAVPAGWRLPTDEDWQKLEVALGMSEGEAAARGWRGGMAQTLLEGNEGHSAIAVRMSGYYTSHTTMATPGYRFMGSRAFFWTATQDSTKEGEYYFYREFQYNQQGICRESMETEENMLSVRFVRDAE